MARYSHLQPSFTGGEWSPIMQGRVDIEAYQMALDLCLNMIPLQQGAITRRPGFAFLHATKDPSVDTTRLISFRHNSGNDYILEFGDLYMRAFVNQGIVVNSTQAIEDVTLASPGVVSITSHGFTDTTRIELFDMVGTHQLDGREAIVTNAATNTFELADSNGTAIDTTNYGAFTSGNVADIFELTMPYSAADVDAIHYVQNESELYLFHPSYRPRILTREAATTWTLTEFHPLDGPYLATNVNTETTLSPIGIFANGAEQTITDATDDGGGEIGLEITAHPFTTGQAVLVKNVTGTTEANGYWQITNLSANTISLDGSTFTNVFVAGGTAEGLVPVTASQTNDINGGDGFVSTDVGRDIRMLNSGTTQWGWGEIEFVDSTTLFWVDVTNSFISTDAKTSWRLGAWSDTTGWPRTGAFHEDRLWAGGTDSFPQRVDGSKTGLYTNFEPSGVDGTVADDNAVALSLVADDLHEIRWMGTTNRGLAVGTTRGEWLLKAGSTTAEVITPTNATARPSTYHGSTTKQPARVGSAILFTQRGAQAVREFAYLFEKDDFTAPEVSLFAEHLLRPALEEVAVQNIPYTAVWYVRSDGTLVGMSYERDQQIAAWHQHVIGGYSEATATTAAKVESIALVPSADGTQDQLYTITKRYIDGATWRYIEYATKTWEVDVDEQEDAIQLDCAWTQIDTVATTTVSSLWMLEGQTVSILGDGAKYPPQVVSNGIVTTSLGCLVLTVGFPYNSDLKTLPVEGGSRDGSSNAKIRRNHRIGFNLADTLGIEWGPDTDNLNYQLSANWSQYTYGNAVPLFSGLIRERFEADYDLLGHLYVRAQGPFPATILSISPQLNVYDDT